MTYPPPITEGFRESLRYEYDLTPDSRVIDIGAHKGTFALEISRRYSCFIDAYEPIAEFYRSWEASLPPKVTLHREGVSSYAGNAIFRLQGDSTGALASGDPISVQLAAIADVLPSTGCDLLKLNIEGAEYNLLDAMLSRSLTTRCRNIQVQFHGNVLDCVSRHASIKQERSKDRVVLGIIRTRVSVVAIQLAKDRNCGPAPYD